MGLPQVLTSDQGGEFVNKLNDELMKILGIKHHLTTAYHPRVPICYGIAMYILLINVLQHTQSCIMHFDFPTHLHCIMMLCTISYCRQMALTRGSTRPCKTCL